MVVEFIVPVVNAPDMGDAFISENNFINKLIENSFKILNRVPLIKKKIMKVASGREIF